MEFGVCCFIPFGCLWFVVCCYRCAGFLVFCLGFKRFQRFKRFKMFVIWNLVLILTPTFTFYIRYFTFYRFHAKFAREQGHSFLPMRFFIALYTDIFISKIPVLNFEFYILH